MFHRYSERARRTIFFARYEASVFGSSSIESYHLLLAILREYPTFNRDGCAEELRREMEQKVGKVPPVSTSVDLPLAKAAKRVLELAMEQADVLRHPQIDGGHLLLALVLRERGLVGELLAKHGIDEAFVKGGMPGC